MSTTETIWRIQIPCRNAISVIVEQSSFGDSSLKEVRLIIRGCDYWPTIANLSLSQVDELVDALTKIKAQVSA